MIDLLIALYPARWRQRYGEEFRAVLESRAIGPFDVADVLLGALDARLTPFRLPGTAGSTGGPGMLQRLGGYGAIVGGASWIVGSLGVLSEESGAFMAVLLLGTAGLLLALVGLSAFQARTQPALAWAAFAIPALGALIAIVGMAGILLAPESSRFLGLSAWEIMLVGLLGTLVGSVLFAGATYRTRVFSRAAAIAVAVTAVAFLGVVVINLSATDNSGGGLPIQLVIGTFGASWVWLGASALRGEPVPAAAPA